MGWWNTFTKSWRERYNEELAKRGISPGQRPFGNSPLDQFSARHQTIMAKVNQFTYSNVIEARHTGTAISHAQQELRLLQKEIRQLQQAMRAQGRDKRQKKQLDLPTTWLLGIRNAQSQRARTREHMKRKEEAHLQQYEDLLLAIDRSILALDRVKLDITRWINSQKP